ncbi:MAG: GntR family transcriptional regulator [Candidatus Dormibacteraeota bacterium]|uniref:GntR family transcriptional regulator n=1 Tax=Candidatus Amunia macphersoniae TaxID=3127014 RepID=A0A934KP91_9BACT|nr:GntR family transcriptional regulator [Candidatus Dormibacteraeota bacterium]
MALEPDQESEATHAPGSRGAGEALPIGRLGSRQKLGHEVARYLRDAILSGTFVPGQRLGVTELAAVLGVSTMPVREALVGLAGEGLVSELARHGFHVARFHSADIADVYRVHAFVAGLLAEAAAPLITEAQLQELRVIDAEIAELHAQTADAEYRSDAIEALNYRFHRLINWVSDHDRLRWYLRTASQYVPRHFYARIPGWIERTVDDHGDIIDALAARDGVTARRLIEEHVDGAGALVIANLKQPDA